MATVVNAYRQVLDGADPATFDRDLEAVSHRPYSTGFFYGSAEQAPYGPEYAQTHALAGTVESCTEREDGLFDVRIDLRNRFFEGDELEVLSPARPVRTLVAADVRHVVVASASVAQTGFEAFRSDASPKAAVETEEPVSVADRATDSYVIASPFPLQSKDILRVGK